MTEMGLEWDLLLKVMERANHNGLREKRREEEEGRENQLDSFTPLLLKFTLDCSSFFTLLPKIFQKSLKKCL